MSVEADGDLAALPAAVEVAAYRITLEAVTNAARHADARHCQVRLCHDGALTVEVRDDGVGLLPGWHAGVGLTSMRSGRSSSAGRCTSSRPTAVARS